MLLIPRKEVEEKATNVAGPAQGFISLAKLLMTGCSRAVGSGVDGRRVARLLLVGLTVSEDRARL